MKNHQYLVCVVKTANTKAEALQIARNAKLCGNEASAWIQGWDENELDGKQLQLYDTAGSKAVVPGINPIICEECNPLAARV